MKPQILITDNAGLQALVSNRFLSLRVTDTEGIQADRVEVRASTPDTIAPPQGEFKLAVGYADLGLVDLGIWELQRFEYEFPPPALRLEGRARNFAAAMSQALDRSWHETTLGDIATTIARKYGYEAVIDPGLAAIEIAHEDQIQQSDLSFLRRLATSFGARMKMQTGKLAILKPGASTNKAGESYPTHKVAYNSLTSFGLEAEARRRWQSVRADWHDVRRGYREHIVVGDGEPLLQLRGTFADAKRAQAAAEGQLRAAQAQEATLRLTMPGNAHIGAKHRLSIEGVPGWIGSDWIAKTVTHKISADQGFTTSIEADSPVPYRPDGVPGR